MIRYVDGETGFSSLGGGLDSGMGYFHFMWTDGFYCAQIYIQLVLLYSHREIFTMC